MEDCVFCVITKDFNFFYIIRISFSVQHHAGKKRAGCVCKVSVAIIVVTTVVVTTRHAAGNVLTDTLHRHILLGNIIKHLVL